MASGEFIWSDLSTFDLNQSKRFYGDLFGWRFVDTGDYHIGYASRSEAAAVYVMPEFFQKINMPSFWMSYIHVDNIEEVVVIANSQGGKVELGPGPFGVDGEGQIALIRDPLGAGLPSIKGLI